MVGAFCRSGNRHRYYGGDLNSDDVTDEDDWDIFQQNFGADTSGDDNPTKWSKGDFDYDGDVDFSDFLTLSDTYTGSEPLE